MNPKITQLSIIIINTDTKITNTEVAINLFM